MEASTHSTRLTAVDTPPSTQTTPEAAAMGDSTSTEPDSSSTSASWSLVNWDELVIQQGTTFRTVWSSIMFVASVYVIICVPLRIGFVLTDWVPWLATDILSDLCFWLDILFTFFLAFEHEGEKVVDLSLIRHRYATSWLWLDVVAALPLEFIVYAMRPIAYQPWMHANRCLRVGQIAQTFLQWEKVSGFKPSVVRIVKSVFIVFLLTHFVACAYHFVIWIGGEDESHEFAGVDHIFSKSMSSRYIRSFYWGFATMTGYNHSEPTTQLQTTFAIFVTLLGIALFATIIGTVGSLVTNLDSSKLYFRQKMDSINEYMAYKKIPGDLQVEVRNYFMYLWRSGRGLDKNRVLDDLPPYLKNKINIFLNSGIIRKVPLFENCKDDIDFIHEIVKALRPRVSLPNTFVVRRGQIGTEMFFVSRGELNVMGEDLSIVHTVRDGGFFGEVALLYDTKRTASIVARTYCDMFILTKEDFQKVLRRFPEQSDGIYEVAKARFAAIHAQYEETLRRAQGGGDAKDEDDEEEEAATKAAVVQPDQSSKRPSLGLAPAATSGTAFSGASAPTATTDASADAAPTSAESAEVEAGDAEGAENPLLAPKGDESPRLMRPDM